MDNKTKKKIAKQLYIAGNNTQKDIANQVGCAENTLKSWIVKGDWDAARDAKTITRTELLQESYAQLKAVNQSIADDYNGIPNKQLSDAKAVLRKEIEALSELPFHQIISVLTEMTEWLKSNHPSELLRFTELMNSFIENTAQNG